MGACINLWPGYLPKKLEEFDPMFIEEPVLCEQMEYFPEIAAACNIPIATGERLYSRYDFKRLFRTGGVDIIQPDLSHAGGITEVRKIAAMAEAYDVALAPHCPLGPIALAACLNVDACSYNAVIQEQSMGIHYNVGKSVLDYVLNPEDFTFIEGYANLPSRPGLGVEINRELVLEENRNPHNWKKSSLAARGWLHCRVVRDYEAADREFLKNLSAALLYAICHVRIRKHEKSQYLEKDIPERIGGNMKLDKENMRKLKELILFTIIILIALWNYTLLFNWIRFAFGIIFPFLLGGAIAFVLNVPMSFLEEKIFGNRYMKEKKVARRLARPLSFVLTLRSQSGV